MEANETPQLDYGAPVPWQKRRRVRRIIIALVLLAASTPAAGQVLTSELLRGAKFWVPVGATDAQTQSTLQVVQSGGEAARTAWPAQNWGQPLVPQPSAAR